ncbi:MAG TPA: amino acid adenylation domain-containing protein [Polyangiaceae bacterium]|nr:amino acid adenylation domain-containing protein [Polyangiaceae bacterium]
MTQSFEAADPRAGERAGSSESACEGHSYPALGAFAHERFERRAALAPDAPAVRFKDARLSYGELNRAANRLAHELFARGVGAGDRVIVCVEPSLDIAVALLGVLKAGAVYVPLDPTYPEARMRAIIEDTEPRAVLTQQKLADRLPVPGGVLVRLEHVSPELFGENPGRAVAPNDTAYVFYTSGTTGKPKGVMGSHANLRHYVEVAVDRYGIDDRDVIPAIARFGFSISLFELMSPLVAGATLVVLEREHVLDPARMARSLAESTLFHAGPSLLRGLLAHVRQTHATFEAFAGVRHASSGGDMVSAELLESMKEIFPNAEIFVIYGSSEISCMGCTYPVPRGPRLTKSYVGRPFDNVSVRVLGTDGRVVPAGVVGEIHFAGEGVTQGYLKLPELTAERYVAIDGRRYYRMGDRGRMSPDGWLELVGRTDFQTKIRGMRVELGDVEHELRRAPGVRDGVVSARAASDGEKRLVAYVVFDENPTTGAGPARMGAVRSHLVAALPDYMVPSVYVELERLPLNENMKVDRRALPEPHESDLRALAREHVRDPESPTERALAASWHELLGVRRVSLDDNFFELGGHSLLALRFCTDTERNLGVRLEGIEVLREPLAVLARLCDERRGLPSTRPSAAGARGFRERPETFHFGPGQSLYGVLHAEANARSDTAVLVAGPVGHESARARFVLNKLGRELAREGKPTLLFDYFGCGDSLGGSGGAELERWQADIAEAAAELRRRTGARRVAAVGVRLGALLLVRALPELDLARLVLWDPVHDGAAHHRSLRSMQRAYLKSVAHLGFLRRRRAKPPANELLGTTFSPRALVELDGLALSPLLARTPIDIRWLATAGAECGAALASNVGAGIAHLAVECVEFGCDWCDLAAIEDTIADAGLSNALRAMVRESP